MTSSGENPDGVTCDELHQRMSQDGGIQTTSQKNGSQLHELEQQDGTTPSITPKEPSQKPDVGGFHISQLDKEGSISSLSPRELAPNPRNGSHALPAGYGHRIPVTRGKVLEDGYNWRKYGQKLKGSELLKSYYRCTHPRCQVKKQIEHCLDGKIVDVTYINQHDHTKPQANLPLAAGFVPSIADGKTEETSVTRAEEGQAPSLKSNASQVSTVTSSENAKCLVAEPTRKVHEADNSEDPPLKRQKKGSQKVDQKPIDKQTGEPRLMVQTESNVDTVTDGYRWRKYGQKMVKGNTNLRSYYRCSSPGCPAKKQVERAGYDSKLATTTYEGQHNHEIPPSKTVTHNTIARNGTENGESSSKSRKDEMKSLDIHSSTASGSKQIPKEQQHCKKRIKTEGNETKRSNGVAHASSVHDKAKSTTQQSGNSSAIEESNTAGVDMAVKSSPIPNSKSNEEGDQELDQKRMEFLQRPVSKSRSRE